MIARYIDTGKMSHGINNIVRVDNLMYRGCEPHWKCKICGDCVPFHCWTKEQFSAMECKGGSKLWTAT